MERKYLTRSIEKNVKTAGTEFPVIIVTGPRQTGKSTMLCHLFPDYDYITLDDPVKRRIAENHHLRF